MPLLVCFFLLFAVSNVSLDVLPLSFCAFLLFKTLISQAIDMVFYQYMSKNSLLSPSSKESIWDKQNKKR